MRLKSFRKQAFEGSLLSRMSRQCRCVLSSRNHVVIAHPSEGTRSVTEGHRKKTANSSSYRKSWTSWNLWEIGSIVKNIHANFEEGRADEWWVKDDAKRVSEGGVKYCTTVNNIIETPTSANLHGSGCFLHLRLRRQPLNSRQPNASNSLHSTHLNCSMSFPELTKCKPDAEAVTCLEDSVNWPGILHEMLKVVGSS